MRQLLALLKQACAANGLAAEELDYIIPANDDAIRSIRLFTAKIADAAIEWKARWDAKGGDRDADHGGDDRDAASERRGGDRDRRGPRRDDRRDDRRGSRSVQVERKPSAEGEAPAAE